MIWQLVRKDWMLARWPFAGYLGLGLVSVAAIASTTPIVHYAGFVIVLSTVVVIGAHVVFGFVLPERNRQTLTFLMSLPLSFRDYTWSKLVGGIGMFFMLWLAIVLGVLAVVGISERLPNGLIPFVMILFLYLFCAFVLTLAVALITESEPWTVVVTTICNISISIVLFAVISIPGIGSHMEAAAPVWNRTAVSVVLVEIGAIALLVGATLFFQSRKTEFV